MKIIISPAKKMRVDRDFLDCSSLPLYIDKAEILAEKIKSLSFPEVKKLWKCNDSIANENFERFSRMDLRHSLTPSILSYDGIQYKYMAPAVFQRDMLSYIQENLRILSGFYGILRPMDGVTPYRLEMQSKLSVDGYKDLYEFWGDMIYNELKGETIIDLASVEYSKCVKKYLTDREKFITCVFGELKDGKVIQKGTYAKMARGEAVRYMAEKGIRQPEDLKSFDRLGYSFAPEFSSENQYVFLRDKEKAD